MHSLHFQDYTGIVKFSRRQLLCGSRSVLIENLVDYDLSLDVQTVPANYRYTAGTQPLAIVGGLLACCGLWWSPFAVPLLISFASLAALARLDQAREPTVIEWWAIVLQTQTYKLRLRSADRAGIERLYARLSEAVDSAGDVAPFAFNVGDTTVVNMSEDKSVSIGNAYGVQTGAGSVQFNSGAQSIEGCLVGLAEAISAIPPRDLPEALRQELRDELAAIAAPGNKIEVRTRLQSLLVRIRDGSEALLPVAKLIETLLSLLK